MCPWLLNVTGRLVSGEANQADKYNVTRGCHGLPDFEG